MRSSKQSHRVSENSNDDGCEDDVSDERFSLVMTLGASIMFPISTSTNAHM